MIESGPIPALYSEERWGWSIWGNGSSDRLGNSASQSPSRRSAESCAPWATGNSDCATIRQRRARSRILKNFPAPGGSHAREGARLRHDRNLVRRRGSRSSKRDEAGEAAGACPRNELCSIENATRSQPQLVGLAEISGLAVSGSAADSSATAPIM